MRIFFVRPFKRSISIFSLFILICVLFLSFFAPNVNEIPGNTRLSGTTRYETAVAIDKNGWSITPSGDWSISTPEQQGMSSIPLAEMNKYINDNDLGVDSVLVIKNGYLVSENYFGRWTKDMKHPLYSCTKSITSALVGIALDKGYIKSLDSKLLDYFPDYNFNNVDENKKNIKLIDVLKMAAGFTPWDDKTNSAEMVNSDDWVKYVLDRTMATEPGQTFNYNTGTIHVLSAVITRTTGMWEEEFAQKYLFDPLGITDIHWSSDPQGNSSGGGLLAMRPRDLAKFGYLFLKGGIWNGQQVVPSDWVAESTTKQIDVVQTSVNGYGYLWWMRTDGYCAVGRGGQFLFVLPKRNIVVVITSNSGKESLIYGLVSKYVVPADIKRQKFDIIK